MSEEIELKDVLLARLKAAIHCLNLNDIEGCKYSLQIALKTIEENKSNER